MAKKKFKDTNLGRILIGAAGVISPALGNILDGTLSAGEALSAIKSSDISPEDKAKLEQLYINQQIVEDQEITKRWESDNKSSAFTRYVRPSLLIYLVAATSILVVSDSYGGFDFEVKEQWSSLITALLVTAFGAYFGGKSVEKTFRK